MPKMAKKKKPKRKLEDEEDAPTISTSNSKPVEIDDEDNSPFVSQSNEMKKKKRKKNPIDDPKKGKIEENEACYLPGQKHDRPNERDPLRIFLETLYQQLPECELAATWMMEWGLLPPDEATMVYKSQLKKNQQGEFWPPADAASPKKTSKVSSTNRDKKRKVIENSSSDDFILSNRNKKKRKRKQKVSSS